MWTTSEQVKHVENIGMSLEQCPILQWYSQKKEKKTLHMIVSSLQS